MVLEEIKEGLGRTLLTTFSERCRIIFVGVDYFRVDFPENRIYYTNGKLVPMPTKNVYYRTRNLCWNLKTFLRFDDGYKFEMQKFERGMLVVKKEDIEPNVLPEIEGV